MPLHTYLGELHEYIVYFNDKIRNFLMKCCYYKSTTHTFTLKKTSVGGYVIRTINSYIILLKNNMLYLFTALI